MDKAQLTELLKRKQTYLSMAQTELAKQAAEIDNAISRQQRNNDPALVQVFRGKVSDWQGRHSQTQDEISELRQEIAEIESRLSKP